MSLWRETSARRGPTRMRHGMACGISPSFVVAQKGNQGHLRTHKKRYLPQTASEDPKRVPLVSAWRRWMWRQTGRQDGEGRVFRRWRGEHVRRERRVREVKGRRTGRDFRSRGGRIVFFCGFGKRKPPERERLGLKLEWARLMTDQFCAAGSQAQRGAACARVPDFPLCGGWEWWGVAAGHWAPGSGHCWEPALGGCGRCRPSPGGAVEPLLGAGAIQPYKLETGRRSTEEQHPIPTLTRIRGGEGPLLPPSTPYTGPIQIDGRGVPSGILEAWSSSLSFQPSFRVLCRCHCRPFCSSPDRRGVLMVTGERASLLCLHSRPPCLWGLWMDLAELLRCWGHRQGGCENSDP